MKKLITLTVICLLSSIIISCKSSSILKRHYNKGYYVHHAAKHAEPKANNTKVAIHKEPVFVTPIANEQVIAKTETKQQISEQKVTAAAEQKAEVKANTATKSSQFKQNSKFVPSAFSMKQNFKTIKDLKAKIASGDAAGEALSLLWILIIVLLIIYLLGFAFDMYGIGPIFNLLALIIVVLLILWLLRIL